MKASSAASLSIFCMFISWVCLLDAIDPNSTTVHNGQEVNMTMTTPRPTNTLHNTTVPMMTAAEVTTSGDHNIVGSSSTPPASNTDGGGKAETLTVSWTAKTKATKTTIQSSTTMANTTKMKELTKNSKIMTVLVLLLLFALIALGVFLAKRRNRDQVRDRVRDWVRGAEARLGFRLCPTGRTGHQREADTNSLAEEGAAPDDDSSDDYSSFGGMNLQEGIKGREEGGAQREGEEKGDQVEKGREQEENGGDSTAGEQWQGAGASKGTEAGETDITIL
ncbi:uncharacterized protein LOC108929991 [Scleropages formosus]|uniref:uncharacterized protein LOC108929991 n=1 Tax=Scleropages formosus TaxID=113540 RepID=UPI0008781B16|nr:uncharacterized protein LOC108929991 [Scleropages formosus]